MAPSAGAVVVVANTHCTSFGIQNVCAMAFGVHPGIHDFFRRNAAPCGILASSGIRHAVLAENSVPLGTIGTNVRIDGCDLFGALLSSCGELCIAHDQGLQAVLLAFVYPLIIVFAAIVTGTSMQWEETTSGLTGLLLLVPYYCILYFLRDKLKKRFIFTLKKLN